MLAQVMTACSVVYGLAASAASAAPTPADAALFARLDANKDSQLTGPEVPTEHRRLFERLLRKADENRDQALSREEFIAGLSADPPQKLIEEKEPAELPGADAIRWLLLSMDTDGDGSITSGEVPERLRATFQSLTGQIDRNQNGVLDRQELSQGGRQLSNIAMRIAQQQQVDVAAELAKLRQSQGTASDRFEGRRGGPPDGGPDNPQQTFRRLDANGDGQLILAEVPEPQQRRIQQMLRVADRDRNGRLSEEEFIEGSRQLGGRRGGRGRRGQAPVLDAQRGRGGVRNAAGAEEGDSMDAMDAMPVNSTPVGKSPGSDR
jgi:Ca2+-binding EF-hand superfamily protein